MKVVVQRSNEASVKVKDTIVGKIEKGLVVLVGFTYGDTIKEIKYLANKIVNLRIFDDENGIMNKSIKDVGGSILSVSQFTLYADTNKGNRPSYVNALKENEARILYDIFNEEIKSLGINVEIGIFREDMIVSITNIGPTTIIIEKKGDKNE
ncbi:d-tyrosyl-tRNA(Tyr) deacylase [Clostridium sp. CAG:762]|nr:d-tyrosyl-tRNA(Tyr) deacylase [Clostridium sp. CAG:762]